MRGFNGLQVSLFAFHFKNSILRILLKFYGGEWRSYIGMCVFSFANTSYELRLISPFFGVDYRMTWRNLFWKLQVIRKNSSFRHSGGNQKYAVLLILTQNPRCEVQCHDGFRIKIEKSSEFLAWRWNPIFQNSPGLCQYWRIFRFFPEWRCLKSLLPQIRYNQVWNVRPGFKRSRWSFYVWITTSYAHLFIIVIPALRYY